MEIVRTSPLYSSVKGVKSRTLRFKLNSDTSFCSGGHVIIRRMPPVWMLSSCSTENSQHDRNEVLMRGYPQTAMFFPMRLCASLYLIKSLIWIEQLPGDGLHYLFHSHILPDIYTAGFQMADSVKVTRGNKAENKRGKERKREDEKEQKQRDIKEKHPLGVVLKVQGTQFL